MPDGRRLFLRPRVSTARSSSASQSGWTSVRTGTARGITRQVVDAGGDDRRGKRIAGLVRVCAVMQREREPRLEVVGGHYGVGRARNQHVERRDKSYQREAGAD